MDALVRTDWLADELGADDLRVVDATFYPAVPGAPIGDAAAEFEAAHIPGAVFMDLAAMADRDTHLPSMLPPADQFAAAMSALGIGDADRVVLYDRSPYRTAARAWWMLQAFGKSEVAILDGGFAKWQDEGHPVTRGAERPARRRFAAHPDKERVRNLAQMAANLDTAAEQVLDARGAARFTGDEPDPHHGTASGHIPGSKNLPYARLFNPDGTWKTADALRAEFDAAEIDLAKPLVTTCGSGITAAVLAFGAHLLGNEAALYDGSWSEWGADPASLKATGPA
ncbi:sulfurtransferase [Sphingomonas sp.]|jgi:thiosulfate/3-mercaptopyruvate sulfurtransferase|uniref:sulfurtransferase n=1 Tax=Sphingomonas sp. TaxID=28214 RepID=UPI002E2F7B25|nr:sulfurtransferase [Sphingomonas sp.]HEX4694971.1 sulfurtransferase [Sphingomonas sp.]